MWKDMKCAYACCMSGAWLTWGAFIGMSWFMMSAILSCGGKEISMSPEGTPCEQGWRRLFVQLLRRG